MKENVKMFIIGVLVGLVVATGAFLIYTELSSKNQIPSNMPSMPNGEYGEPPERPNSEPPEMPNGNNSQDNSSESNSY